MSFGKLNMFKLASNFLCCVAQHLSGGLAQLPLPQ